MSDEEWVIHNNPMFPHESPPFLVDKSVIYKEGDTLVLELFLDAERVAQINEGRLTRQSSVSNCAPDLIRPCLWRGYVPLKPRTLHSTVAMRHYQVAQRNSISKAAASATPSTPGVVAGTQSMSDAVELVVVKIGYGDFVAGLFNGFIIMDGRFDGVNFSKPLTVENYGSSFELVRYGLDAEVIEPGSVIEPGAGSKAD
jgi:hypothetical protein